MWKRMLLFVVLFSSLHLQAQLHFDVNVQNMHLWRGIEVADGLVLTSNVSVSDSKNRFKLGVWGGTNANGSYKESRVSLSIPIPVSVTSKCT